METTVTGAGTLTFWWKVSSESGGDYLEFYLDSQLQSGRISGEVAWTQKSYTITGGGPHTLRWRYVKDGSSRSGDDCGWVDWVIWQAGTTPPDSLGEAVDSLLAYTTGGSGNWAACSGGYYGNDAAQSPTLSLDQESWLQTTVQGPGTFTFWAKLSAAYSDPDPGAPQQLNSFAAYTKGGDAPWVADPSGFAQSGDIDYDQESWMYIDVSGPGTVAFQWKVSSEQGYDFLEFYIDGYLANGRISGTVDWTQESYTVTGSGTHRLKWRYGKDVSFSSRQRLRVGQERRLDADAAGLGGRFPADLHHRRQRQLERRRGRATPTGTVPAAVRHRRQPAVLAGRRPSRGPGR